MLASHFCILLRRKSKLLVGSGERFVRRFSQQPASPFVTPFDTAYSPVSIQTHATQACALRTVRTLRALRKKYNWFYLAFSAKTACVSCVNCACVIFLRLLRFLRTFYFACVLFLTKGLACVACVWMEIGLISAQVTRCLEFLSTSVQHQSVENNSELGWKSVFSIKPLWHPLRTFLF